jgi:hypothetical protein
MTNDDIFTLSLEFPGFSIDFDVNKQASIERTLSYEHCHWPDFVFSVAEVWLRIGDSRHLFVSEIHTGNLVEELKWIRKNILDPISIQGIEEIIPCGGWGIWMPEYWNRIDAESTTAEDERLYDLLIPSSLMDGREGHIAAYRYNGIPIIEAATYPLVTGKSIYVWAAFDPKKVADEIQQISQFIVTKILYCCKHRDKKP